MYSQSTCKEEIAAARMEKSILAPPQYDSAMDDSLFETWFAAHLLPGLPPGSLAVMYNASFHRKSKPFHLAEQAGVSLVFLPPYSPEYNPIKHFLAWLKRRLRKTMPIHSSFNDALFSDFQVC